MRGFARSRIVASIVALAMATVLAAPAMAGEANVNYHATFDSDGRHHVSFGRNGGVVTTTELGIEVAFGPALAPAVATVAGDQFSWAAPAPVPDKTTPCPDWHPYDNVVYSGTVDR